MKERLIKAMGDLDEEGVVSCVEALLSAGADPLLIIELCRAGFEVVGRRYECREYYLSGLILSDDIFKNVMSILDSSGCFRPRDEERLGKVVLGAPLGDVHDIGKGIVAQLLRYSGFEVIDLGVNVRPADFLETAAESGAAVVGISTLITVAYESLRETVLGFEREGLRDKVKIMLGGGAVSQRVCEYAGADAWSREASDAVRFAKGFTGKE
ncbi:MAG: cobalamin-dependent protein [Actinomycetota bacterium]|nr:cobalamin-dependent protein [Actinomycetota bacterium]